MATYITLRTAGSIDDTRSSLDQARWQLLVEDLRTPRILDWRLRAMTRPRLPRADQAGRDQADRQLRPPAIR